MNKKETSIFITLATIAINNKEGFTVSATNLQPAKKRLRCSRCRYAKLVWLYGSCKRR